MDNQSFKSSGKAMTTRPSTWTWTSGTDYFIASNPSDEKLHEAIEAAQAHGAKLIAERDRRAGCTASSLDPGCICFGNWRFIVEETRDLLDNVYVEEYTGDRFTLIGVLHGSDDYYYAMYDPDKGLKLLSCVGSIEQMGFTPLKDKKEAAPTYPELQRENLELKARLAEYDMMKMCKCSPEEPLVVRNVHGDVIDSLNGPG